MHVLDQLQIVDVERTLLVNFGLIRDAYHLL